MLRSRRIQVSRSSFIAIVSWSMGLGGGCAGGGSDESLDAHAGGALAGSPAAGGRAGSGGALASGASSGRGPAELGGASSGGRATSAGGGNGSGGAASGGATGGTPAGGFPGGGAPAGGSLGASGGSVGDAGGGESTGDVSTGGKPADSLGGAAGAAPSNGGTTASGGHSGGVGPVGGRAGDGGGAGSAGAGAGQGGVADTPPVAVTKDSDGLLTYSGLTVVSYGGYLNGESFQQDGIVSYAGYQYAAFWNTNRNIVLARRRLPSGEWAKFDLTDYSNTADDAHNTISIGICPEDGTLHLAFDHHGDTLHYRRSVEGFVSAPETATWAASSFTPVTSALVGGSPVHLVTYPRFVTEPGGTRMLLSARIGESGAGDEHLWEYDGATHTWTELGKYIDGVATNVNGYLHGLAYTRGGGRLHAAWCWRETPDASTNHDLLYMYSDDDGRTWHDDYGAQLAVTGVMPATANTAGLRVHAIGQNRGLINQEHLAVDAQGRVHVLLSHMPDGPADDRDFTSARTKSEFFHYWRRGAGQWTRGSLSLPVVANFRGKLAVAASDNLYAVLPDLRIAAASAASSYTDWALLDASDSGRFFSDPLIDTARLAEEDRLTVFYPVPGSPNIHALDYTVK